ncbi:MAG: CoA transferase [Limnohabitans sp.]|nr:CoA transferase [Limnohabitans sp.]
MTLVDKNDLPLNDLLVVDLSRLVSGNILTHVLADLGAEVLKIESPGKGDDLRAWRRGGVSTYWLAYCRNKQSVALNLREADDLQALKDLLSRADVLVENFRPGVLEKMGLSRAQLQTINPKLVVMRISGWGQTGLFAGKPGFGSLIEAFSGFAAMNGFADRPPVLPPFALADTVAGLYGAAIANALVLKQRRCAQPEVQEVDLSLFEPLFAMLGPQAAEYTVTGQVYPRAGSRSPTHAPRNVYQTRDGTWIALSAGMDGTLARLFAGIGCPEAMDDPRFSTHEARIANVDALDALIQNHVGQLSLQEALDFFEERDITAGPVFDISDLMQHPYVRDRQMLVDTTTPEERTLPVHATPFVLNGVRPAIRRAAPSLGQDNARWVKHRKART